MPLNSAQAGLRETMVGYYRSHGRDPFGAIPLTFVAARKSFFNSTNIGSSETEGFSMVQSSSGGI